MVERDGGKRGNLLGAQLKEPNWQHRTRRRVPRCQNIWIFHLGGFLAYFEDSKRLAVDRLGWPGLCDLL